MKNADDDESLHCLGGLDHRKMQRLLGYNLAQACIPSFAIFDEAIGAPLELRQVEFTILVLVESNADVTQKRLSLALGIAAPNLTVIIDRLVKRGLVRRVRSEEDRRAQFVRLTPKGLGLTSKAAAIAGSMEEELLSHLSTAERGMLFELLQKVAVHRQRSSCAQLAPKLAAACS